MESLQKDRILEYNADTLEEVRKCFNLHKPGTMKGAVDILEEWIKKQNHFTKKNFDRRYLEMTIIVSKGSIEKAKSRLDRACTVRTLMPHIFEATDLRFIYKKDLKDVKHVMLPKMTSNHERVYLLKNDGKKFEPTLMRSFNLSMISCCGPGVECILLDKTADIQTTPRIVFFSEYLRRNDYAATNYAVIDYTDTNLTELACTMSFTSMQEIAAGMLDCCGLRLKAIYFISSSKLVGIVTALLKQVMSTKLGERIHVLQNRDELKNVIEKRVLPVEYGGEEKSVDELHELWLDTLTSEDHMNYLKEMSSARTDEALRQKDTFNEHYMGMPGTFRTFSLD